MAVPTKRGINPIVLPDMRNLEYALQEWLRNVRPLLMGSIQYKNVAGAVDVTLSVDEAQTQILELSGVLTASISVIVPTSPWQWTVRNGTTGAYTVTVKTSAGTGITIAQTKRAIIYCDGTNVVRVTADVSNSEGPQAFQ